MKKINLLKNTNGFSLVEIMVAVGMLGVLTLAISQMMGTMGKASKKTNQDFEMRNIVNAIAYNLSDSRACTLTLQNIDPTAAFDIENVKNDADVNIYVAGTRYGAANSTVNQFLLEKMHLINYDNATGRADFQIKFKKEVNAATGVTDGYNVAGGLENSYLIPVRLKLDGASLVEHCYTDKEELAKTICEVNYKGYFDVATQQCQSIQIRNDDANANHSAVLVTTGSVEIGTLIANAAGGNLDVAQSMGVGTKRSTGGTGNILASGSVGVGVAPGNPGDLLSSNGVGIGISNQVKIGTIQTSSDINVNSGMSVGDTGVADPGDGFLVTKNNITILDITNIQDKHAATIGWVKQRVAATISPGPGEASGIAADILDAEYDGDSGLNVVKKANCENSYVNSGNGILTVGTWIAGANNCEYRVLHCSQSGICPNVYSNGIIWAGGNINGVGANSNVQANTNITSTTGFIRAQLSIATNGYIQASSYVLGRSRVCAGASATCYTKFQSATCSGSSSAMVGISNGHIICAPKW